MIAGYAAAERRAAALDREWGVLWQRAETAPTAPDAAEADRGLADARRSLGAFATRMHRSYQTAPHIRRLVAALEWAATTPNARLIVTFPPRHSKSLHVSENFPAWYLGTFPDNRVIGASHTQRLANRFSRRVRNKIAHPFYPFLGVRIASDNAAVEAWDLEGTYGGYFAVGVGGSPAGTGANLIVIDDPIKNAAKAESELARDALWEWYREDIRTRLEPGGSIVVTATRWHDDDLTGRLLTAQEEDGETWRHLHLPAISDAGEALWPERWPIEALLRLKGAVGTRVWQAQYQGAPVGDEGGTFKRHWWRFWHPAALQMPPAEVKDGKGNVVARVPSVPLPRVVDDALQSWDMSFKKTTSGSFVVGQVWQKTGANRYLLDQFRDRVDFPDAVLAVKALSATHPRVTRKLVENKANGPAVVATLKNELAGLIEVEPEGGKEARANAASVVVESGNVYLPHPSLAPWVHGLIDECAAFPHGKDTDQVDALSQAQIHWDAAPAAPTRSTNYVGRPSRTEEDDD